MRVEVEESLFEESIQRRYPNLVSSLFHECSQRGHVVTLDQTRPLFRQWRESQSLLQQEEADLVLARSCELEARLAIDCTIVTGGAATDWGRALPYIGPADLLQVVCQPLAVLVENSGSDGAFLRCMGFGIDRRNLTAAIEQGRLHFELGGGSEYVRMLQALSPHERWRTWAVFDSDALTPDSPSAEALRKQVCCGQLGMAQRCHMLQRRAIENYLPAEAMIREWPHSSNEKHQRALAFGKMSLKQRAHYNLADGFLGDEARLAPGGPDAAKADEVVELYRELPVADREQLEKGFGKKPLRALFVPDRLSDAMRRKDGQQVEMEPLIRSILRWL